jgi:hypothetical protein
LGTVRFFVDCAGDAEEILGRAKEVLRIVLNQDSNRWPSKEEWRKLFPIWLIHQFAPEKTQQEAEREVQDWRRLYWGGKREEAEQLLQRTTTVSDWIYCFLPKNRYWSWWDAAVVTSDLLVVAVEVREWPFPWEDLAWLFRAAGALDVRSEP